MFAPRKGCFYVAKQSKIVATKYEKNLLFGIFMKTSDAMFEAMRRRGLNAADVSRGISRPPGYLSNLRTSNSEPSAKILRDFCCYVGVEPNQILGFADNVQIDTEANDKSDATELINKVDDLIQRSKPTTDALLDWWRTEGGDVRRLGMLRDHVIIFEAPDPNAKLVKAVQLGARSLASQQFGASESDHLNKIIEAFDPDLNVRLVSDYREGSLAEMPVYSFEFLVTNVLGQNSRVKVGYDRWRMPVHAGRGKQMTLVYCRYVNTEVKTLRPSVQIERPQ